MSCPVAWDQSAILRSVSVEDLLMSLNDRRRRQLMDSLLELRRDRPIDNGQIERGLVAILEALLDETETRPLIVEDSGSLLRGTDLGR
jgi:hypothetical protein